MDYAKAKPLTKAEIMLDKGKMVDAGNRIYEISPLTLAEVMSGEIISGDILLPTSENPGRGQLYNMSKPEIREKIDGLMQKYLTCGGAPVTLQKCIENAWTLDDLGMFLLKISRLSG